MNLNKAQLIGRMTKDPELRTLPGGSAMVRFGLATNHSYTIKAGEKAGEKKETTQFHNCVAFSRTAEIINQYCKKGKEIYVEGRIETRTWDKSDGTKAYITEIIVENMQMGPDAEGRKQKAEPQEEPQAEPIESGSGDEIDIKDIPF